MLDQIVVDPNAPQNLRQQVKAILSLVRGGGKAAPPAPAAPRNETNPIMTFTVAIIGRPNVGKSTLFNRLVGKKLALVDDQPGVTRDRRCGRSQARRPEFHHHRHGGAGGRQHARSLTGRMRAQTEAAIEEADAIFFVMDARVGVTPEDRHFAALARRAGKPLIVIANKAEGKRGRGRRL